MVVKLRLELTDDERRRVTGTRRKAKREEVVDFVERLVAIALQRGVAAIPVVGDGGSGAADHPAMTCTTLDHIWRSGPKEPTTPCYCGKKTWLPKGYVR